MTEKPLMDRALRMAFNTAAHAAAMLADDHSEGLRLSWAAFDTRAPDPAGHADYLGEFVRANREAPPEALYIHARGVIHDNRVPWAVLPLPDAFAYALFVLVLNQTDARIAEDAEARELRDRVPAEPLPIRDHTLERVDDGGDIFHQLGKPSKRNAKLPPPLVQRSPVVPSRDDPPTPFVDPRLDPKYKPTRRT